MNCILMFGKIMDLSSFLTLVSSIFLAISFCLDGRKGLAMAGFAIAIACIAFIAVLTEKKDNEQIMERIVILEKAKDSTDPTVLEMAKFIREDIIKEQEQKEQSRVAREKRDKFFEDNKITIIIVAAVFNIFAMIFVFKIFNRN